MVVVSVTPVRAPSLNLRVMLSALLSARLVKVATPATAEMESVPCSGPEPVARAATIVLVSVVTTLPKVSST